MQREHLLEKLAAQVATLAQSLSPILRHRTLSARFDKQLFQTPQTEIAGYLQETERNLQRLREAVAEGKTVQASWLATRITDQIAALYREAATWPLRRNDGAHLSVSPLHAQLLRHQDFERRLRNMIKARKDKLVTVADFTQQQLLLRECQALEGRLARCQAALASIERTLERYQR